MNRIRAQRQWTPRERAELRQLRRQNVDYATLAQHFGRTTRAIASQFINWTREDFAARGKQPT